MLQPDGWLAHDAVDWTEDITDALTTSLNNLPKPEMIVAASVVDAASEARVGAVILAIKSGNDARMAPPVDHVIWVGSVLGVLGPRDQLAEFANNQLCRLSTRMRQLGELFNPTRAGISEVVIPPSSRFIKQTIAELRLRKRFGISVLAITRGEQVFRDDVRTVSLRAGDTMVLHSNWRDLSLAAEDKDLVVVTDIPKEEQRPGKIWQAVGFFVLAKCLALFTQLDLSVAMMTGAIGMLLTGVLNMDEAYKAINWKTIFVTACLIPLGWSMDSTGTAAWVAQQVLVYLGSASPWILQASLAVLTLLFSQVMSNVGATVMMVPVAISVAVATGGNPSAYALIVAVSSSNTFLLGSGHPALMMVTGPGGYRAKDFLRVGIPLTLLVLVVTLVSSTNDKDSPDEYAVLPTFRRDSHTNPAIILSINNATVNTANNNNLDINKMSLNSTVNQSFAVLTPSRTLLCASTNELPFKTFNPPIAQLTQLSISFQTYDGNPVDFQNHEHRLELLLTSIRSAKYLPLDPYRNH
ncbi:MAG: hypothetical protein WDW38_006464 [Sanguina aurantia]